MCNSRIGSSQSLFTKFGFILGNCKLSFNEDNKKQIVSITKWKSLKESQKITGDNFFIITGALSGITVFDIDIKNGIDGEDNLMIEADVDLNDYIDECIKIRTPSNGYHYIFPYDERFKTGANCFGIKGFDIRNDDAIAFSGNKYDIISIGKNFRKPSSKITLDKIYKKFQSIIEPIEEENPQISSSVNLKYYELIDMLPDEYFNQYDLWVKPLYALKNASDIEDVQGLATIIELLQKRSKCPNVDEINRIWALDNSKKRFNIGSIINILKKDQVNKLKLNEWYDKWSPKNEDEPKKSLIDILKEKLLEVCDDKYKRERYTGVIYEKQLSYYYTRKYDDCRDFLNDIFMDDPLFTMQCNIKIHQELIHFIKNIGNPCFPFIEINYDYIGFKNGVYDLKNAIFVESPQENIQVRTMLPIDYKITETPLLDKYLKYQFDNDTIDFIYFAIGRMLTKIDDRFDFMVYLYGESGSGKSLLMNLIKYAFSSSQIGLLSNSHQEKFGLSEFAKKQILCCDDMNNLAKTLPKADFLSMCTRGSISCPVKGKSSIEVDDWNIPGIINSNYLPNYTDKAGEVIRRLMILNFENSIDKSVMDTNLEYDIKQYEYPTFLHRCRSKYIELSQKYKGKGIESFCAQSFIDNRMLLREETNISYMFAKDKLHYVKDAQLTVKQLNTLLKDYLKEKYDTKHIPKEKININNIILTDERYIYKTINICKSCKKHHIKGCCANYDRNNRTKKSFIENIGSQYESITFD